MSDNALAAPEAVLAKFKRQFDLYVGQGRRYSVAEVSEGTGLPFTTVKAYKAGERMPSLSSALALMSFLGPDFANGLLQLADLAAYRTPEACQCSPAEIALELAEFGIELQRAVHGGFNHVHRAELAKSVGPKLARIGGALMGGAK